MTPFKKILKPKFIILFALCSIMLSPTIHAQQAIGIYISAADFKNNKLSFHSEGNKKCKIKIHNFSFRSEVKITCGDSVFQFSKDSIYGYKDHDGTLFRFFNKTIYTFMNPGENIMLYKVISTGKTKYEETTYSYYFSKEADSPVLPLTVRDLERSFNNNKTFIDFLEVHFKSDSELLEYDSNYKMYKINHLLELSKINGN